MYLVSGGRPVVVWYQVRTYNIGLHQQSVVCTVACILPPSCTVAVARTRSRAAVCIECYSVLVARTLVSVLLGSMFTYTSLYVS